MAWFVSVVDPRFEPKGSGETKDYKICICCLSPKRAELKSKINDC